MLTRILVALGTVLLLAGSASALITTEPKRFDLAPQPGAARIEETITIVNKDRDRPTEIRVEVAAFEGETVAVHPTALTLEGNARRDVRVTIELPANVSGGRHQILLTFVEVPPGGPGTAVGQAGLTVPFVFRVPGLKIGNLHVETPAPGADAPGYVLVQNFLGAPAAPSVRLEIRDARGVLLDGERLDAPEIPPNATASVPFAIPSSRYPPGAYVVRAEAATGAAVSNAWETTLGVGGPGGADAAARPGSLAASAAANSTEPNGSANRTNAGNGTPAPPWVGLLLALPLLRRR